MKATKQREQETRYCTRCKTVKPLGEFSSSPNVYYCKACERARAAERRKTDPEKQREANKRFYQKHRAEILQEKKTEREGNKEVVRSRDRARYHKNPEPYRATARRYNKKKRALLTGKELEKFREYQRKHNRDYMHRLRVDDPERYKANRERVRRGNMRTEAARTLRRYHATKAKGVQIITVEDIATRDGWGCYLCDKELSLDEATLDHVIPISRGGQHTLENVKLACQRCNSRKGAKLLSELDWIARKSTVFSNLCP